MPRSGDGASSASAPSITAVEVEPPSRRRWRQTPFRSYAWLPPPSTPPEDVLFHKDIEDDEVGIQALFESLTNRETITIIQQSLRTIIFVTLPMYVLANHPNTMFKLGFPQIIVATVVSTSTHQGYLGKQIGMHLFILNGVVLMMLLGLFFMSWGITNHVGAWWGLFAAAMFTANLVKHSILRRFLVLYTLLWMMEVRFAHDYFGFNTITNSCWFAADIMIGSCLGVAALLLPFPLFMHTVMDGLLAKTFTGLGKYLISMQTFVFSSNTHAAENFFANKNPLAGIENALAVAPSLLWFSNREPPEFATRNPIRLVKLSLLRRLLALTYAAQSCGENVVRLRREQADRVALKRHRERMQNLAGRPSEYDDTSDVKDDDGAAGINNGSCPSHSSSHGAGAPQKTDADVPDTTDPIYINARFVAEIRRREGDAAAQKLTCELRRLHQNSITYATLFGTALETCMGLIGTTNSRPKALVEAVPFEDLMAKDVLKWRSMRMETLFVRRCQTNHINRHRQARPERWDVKEEGARVKPSETASSAERKGVDDRSVHPTEENAVMAAPSPVRHEPFRTREDEEDEPFVDDHGDKREVVCTVPPVNCSDERLDPFYVSPEDAAVIADFFDVLENSEVLLSLNEIFFHLLLSMIAGEIQTFAEMMQTYKPEHSLPYRLWMHFIIEPWNDFWEELWYRATLARPCDVRTVKNALQLTAAFLSASALNLQLWKPNNVSYFFGTTIVLGMPVGEEALTQGVTRLAGNTLGCALGYLSLHNTRNLSESLAMSLCLCFICLLFQNHPTFGPCFIYGAILTLAGTPMAQSEDDILQRTMATAWAFCAFMLCCMLIFPSSNIKILWNHRSKLVKIFSEVIDGVADVTRQPIVEAARGAELSARATVAKTDALLSQLHLHTLLAKDMSASCLSWGPIAARENMIRGSLPFPAGASAQVQSGLQRLLAETQLLVFGAQLIHRPRVAAADPVLQSLIAGPVADFLDEFAGMSRTWSQGFIDSLEDSRRWSYPKALNDTSYLSQLKARLCTIFYQILALMNAPLVQGMCSIEGRDFDDMDNDAQRLAHDVSGNKNDNDPCADRTSSTTSVLGQDGRTTHTFKAERESRPSDGDGSDRDALHHSFTSSIAIDPHASFAGRYLAARRQLGDLDDANARRASRDQRLPNDTIVSTVGGTTYQHFAPLHDAKIEFVDEYPLTAQDPEDNLAGRVRTAMRTQAAQDAKQQQRRRRASEMVANEETSTASPASLRRPDPGGRTPRSTTDADVDVQNARLSSPPYGGPGVDSESLLSSTPCDVLETGDTSHVEQFHLVHDKTVLGATFRQLFVMDKSMRHYRPPRYTGPDFTYREDDLDLPVDTDFIAVVCVLASAYDMINEMQNLLSPMATINGYQRQLHEGSVAVDVIENCAERIRSHRESVYARYHTPGLTGDSKRPLGTIASPFHDFAV